MGCYVAKETVKRLLDGGGDVSQMRILVMGLTYKENVQDVRNTRSIDIVNELRSFGIGEIDIVDPVASKTDAKSLYGIEPHDEAVGVYDAIVVAVSHAQFRTLGQEFFDAHLRKGGVLTDVYNLFRSVNGFNIWSL